jgi:hypothetical protein
VVAALLLVLTASAQVGLDVVQLHHMNAGMGWVWDDTNQKVIGWWTILGVGNILLALVSLLRWRPGFFLTAVWGGLFALLWLTWSVTFVAKTGRLEDPELYLLCGPSRLLRRVCRGGLLCGSPHRVTEPSGCGGANWVERRA